MRPGKPKHVPVVLWKAGDAFLPQPIVDFLDTKVITIKGADINYWSGVHFLSGAFIGMFTKNFLFAFVVHSLWEIFQMLIGMTDISKSSETYDIVFDTLFFMLGFMLTR